MLGWFLNLSIALLTGSVLWLLLSAMNLFPFTPRFFVAFLKKLFILAATTLLLDSMSSFSFTSVILLTVGYLKKSKKVEYFSGMFCCQLFC